MNNDLPSSDSVFGIWLKRRRTASALTQSDLAEAAGCSAAMIRKLEADERRPSEDLALALGRALGVAEDELELFTAFARGGWADDPPASVVPHDERPWLAAIPNPAEGDAAEAPSGIDIGTRELELAPPDELHGAADVPEIVARTDELAWLDSRLAEAVAGSARVAFVRGEAGQGKTALLHGFARRARQRTPGIRVAWGICDAYTGAGDPYRPFRDVLTSLAASAPEVRASVAGSALGPFLLGAEASTSPGSSGPAGEALAGSGRHVDSAPGSGIGAPPDRTPLNASAVRRSYVETLARLARRGPLLLVLDDLQWIDRASCDLLLDLGRLLGSTPVFVLGSFRGSDVDAGRAGTRHPLAQIVNELRRLEGDVVLPLDRAEDRAFVDAYLDAEPNRFDASFREALHAQTGGLPLFTVELLRAMRDQGEIVRNDRGEWTVDADVRWAAIPDRVDGVIRERIERLPPDLRRWLDVAAVQGEEFTVEVMARALGVPERDVALALSAELSRTHRLVRAVGVGWRGGARVSTYRFGHNLIQRAIYDGLDDVERAHLHGAVADAMSELHADDLEFVALDLARHFALAGDREQAAVHARTAGRASKRSGALVEATTHFRSALEAWPRRGDSFYAATQRELAECLRHRGRLEEAIANHSEAFEAYVRLGETEAAGACQRDIGRIYWEMGDRASSLPHYQRSIELLEAHPDSVEYARSLSSMSQMHMLAGENEAALDVGNRALAAARRLGARDVEAHVLTNIGTSMTHLGAETFDEAVATLEAGRRLALDVGDRFTAARALFNTGEILAGLGRVDEGRAALQQVTSEATRYSFALFETVADAELFDLEWRAGRWRDAMGRAAWSDHERPEGEPNLSGIYRRIYRALADLDLGLVESALERLRTVADSVERQNELQTWLPYLHGTIGASLAQGAATEVVARLDFLLGLVADASQIDFRAPRALLPACAWLARRAETSDDARLAACLDEIGRVDRLYRSPFTHAAVLEGEGYALLAQGETDAASARLFEAARAWEAGGFRGEALRGSTAAARLVRDDDPAADEIRDFANELVDALAEQLDDTELSARFVALHRSSA